MRKGERIFLKRDEERVFWKKGEVRGVKKYSGKWREEEYSRKEIKKLLEKKGKNLTENG